MGKTELSKALAEFMFGDSASGDASALLEPDMSEYQQEHSVARLIGAPPGYVGYEGGGQLTDHMRVKPYTIVLFDEVEKAHPRVLDVLLQVMEEGRLTDGQGRTTYFNEAVVIMTSNLGSEHLTEPMVDEYHRTLVMDSVKGFFRPEFLNRLDDIVIFSALSPDNLRQILGLLLKSEARLLESRGLGLEVDDVARTWMLAQNDHPEWTRAPCGASSSATSASRSPISCWSVRYRRGRSSAWGRIRVGWYLIWAKPPVQSSGYRLLAKRPRQSVGCSERSTWNSEFEAPTSIPSLLFSWAQTRSDPARCLNHPQLALISRLTVIP